MTGRILIADDDPSTIDHLKTVLSGDGHAVTVVAGREDTLKQVAAAAVDVIVLEATPPNLEGFELIRAVKKADQTVEIIALIRKPDKRAIDRILQYGAYDYLALPDDLAPRLSLMVRHTLEKRHAPAADAGPSEAEERKRTAEVQEYQAKARRWEETVRKVSHDFQNVLAAISGYAYLIEQQLDPDDQMAVNARHVQEAGERGNALIQELLAVDRNKTLALERMEINEVINTLKTMLTRLFREDIELDFDLGPFNAQILMDRIQLERVLINLAANARDAMPDGGRLTVKTEQIMLEKEEAERLGLMAEACVRLLVQDTGTGMDEATKARMFESMFTTKKPGKGTGLGLATVKDIVQQSGGAIEVESELNKGTRFILHLPILRRLSDKSGR